LDTRVILACDQIDGGIGKGDLQNDFWVRARKVSELWKNDHLSGDSRDDEPDPPGWSVRLPPHFHNSFLNPL
jgi:hypothetical protein